MANLLMVDNRASTLVDSPEIFYTSPATGKGTVINAFTASNTSLINRDYQAYIVGVTGSATNPIRPFKIVVWGEVDLGTGIVNQIIPPGGTLRMESSAIDSIHWTVTGQEL